MILAGSKSDLFPVRVRLCQGCPLSPILFIIFMDSISRHSQGVEGVWFGDIRIWSLLYAYDVVLLASSGPDRQLSLKLFASECEASEMRINTSMFLSQKSLACSLQVEDEINFGVLIGAPSIVMQTLHHQSRKS